MATPAAARVIVPRSVVTPSIRCRIPETAEPSTRAAPPATAAAPAAALSAIRVPVAATRSGAVANPIAGSVHRMVLMTTMDYGITEGGPPQTRNISGHGTQRA